MPALGDRSPLSISYMDHSAELRAVGLYSGVLTAGTLPGFLTAFGALQAAIDAVVLGVRARQAFGTQTIVSNTPPANANAQIETEVLVRARGATTQAPYSFRIPTVDYAKFNWIGDSAVLSGAGATAETLALVTALQAVAKMPNDPTEAIVIIAIEVVE